MKNLILSMIAISFITACKKKETQNNISVSDSVSIQRNYSDTTSSTFKDSLSANHDSINTKTHVGGRKTSNNNTGNGTGNINAAVSDSAHNLQGRSNHVNK
ncbi:hypothetical protein ACP3T3_02905 [Chryseobacterium sp. CBSDS_008]|uniref:hypothetical protein n=1 Tax=Chryseobacterium sp. CBSDS_008 TaxID=3415265 RepID=UPI003CF1C6E8